MAQPAGSQSAPRDRRRAAQPEGEREHGHGRDVHQRPDERHLPEGRPEQRQGRDPRRQRERRHLQQHVRDNCARAQLPHRPRQPVMDPRAEGDQPGGAGHAQLEARLQREPGLDRRHRDGRRPQRREPALRPAQPEPREHDRGHDPRPHDRLLRARQQHVEDERGGGGQERAVAPHQRDEHEERQRRHERDVRAGDGHEVRQPRLAERLPQVVRHRPVAPHHDAGAERGGGLGQRRLHRPLQPQPHRRCERAQAVAGRVAQPLHAAGSSSSPPRRGGRGRRGSRTPPASAAPPAPP